MKYLITLLLASGISLSIFADTGVLESVEVNTEFVGIKFEDNDKTLVLDFSDSIRDEVHSVIDIRKINDLKYKTRVMRYFGGLLVNETYKFDSLVVVVDGKRWTYECSRSNISTVVNKMCLQAARIL